ncbi:MAG: 3'(2'),5'-bisphosphate nucleotidase CysQ [Beijerinckiaceae bacterium]|nr:3'(2'),5'-bisphosphate nucleotidase CysQ [Beijerinckiaceae bacterium]
MADLSNLTGLAARMGEKAVEAGAIALDYFEHGGKTSASVSYKDGGSPVSAADIAVDDYLRAQLCPLAPDAGWLSEESTDDPARLGKDDVLVVDPIDGTRAFINGDKRWGVAIALVRNGRPVAAALYMPALQELYLAARGSGATCNGIALRASGKQDLDGATVGGPKKALDAMADRGMGIIAEPRVPSLAYRLARVGSGAVDAGLASTNAWDWDIAAADLIIREAGGLLTGLDGEQPLYNQPVPRHGILAAAGPALHPVLVAAVLAIQAKPAGS